MGNEHPKPTDTLQSINREVNSLRSSIRSTKRNLSSQTKDEYIQVLAKLSNETGDLTGKVKPKYLEQTQKTISETVKEILTKVPASQETNLDMGAVETSSFIQLPVQKRQASNKGSSERPSKKQRNVLVDSVHKNSTLLDIEEKLKTLKPQINVAIENKDTTMLRVHQETIKVLATDLEILDLPEDTPIGNKKKKLESAITDQFKKITKAVKEIKRNKDINYLVKQSKKEKSLKELDEIKDLLSNINLNNSDASSTKDIQDALVEINQRLSSVEVTDEAIKATKLQLLDKLKGLYKYFNNTSQNNSQSDLSKAQSNYEDIVKNITSGQNRDKDDIKIKLESLQSFIDNIKEDDASTLKRKEQLSNNVSQWFSAISENDQKKDFNIENTPRKANASYKELDSLYNNWKLVQKTIKSTTYSAEEVAKIDKILEEIQNSIEHTRRQITGKTSSQLNLKTKLNYSTPNLSSKPRPNLDGSPSSDHSPGSLIKTRAKVYNLSTPEISNVSDQPVVLRNKQFYNNFEYEDSYRFSKIEEIRTQVNYIKEKFPESQQKQHLKNKLESYVEILDGYVHHKNQATSNNAKTVLADIQEMLKNMSHVQEAMNTTAHKSMYVEDSLENIAGIQEAVDKLEKDIETFSGTKDDERHTQMKNGLLSCKKCLDDTKVPPKYDMIQQQKEQILEKIRNLLEILENKDTNYYEDNHVVGIEEAVNRLQNDIVMFSGKKGDKAYTKIRDGLIESRNCLEDTVISPKHDMLQKRKEEVLKKIPHLITTLESKSGHHQEDPVLVITRRNLTNLREKVRRFSGAYKGVLYNKIEKDLNKLLLDVGETIQDKHAVDEIVKDVEKHLKILEHRSTKDQSFRRAISDGKSKPYREDNLVKLKSDLMSIKTAIDTTPTNGVNLFTGLKSRLDLVKLGLDQLKLSSEDDEKQREILYSEVETYKNIVEAKIGLGKQAIRQWPVEQDKNKRYEDEMNKIEEKFRTLKPEIENFVGTTADNKFYELDEYSIRLVLRMDKLQFSKGTEIYNRKINLLKEIYSYGDLLDQRAKETEDIIEIEREIHDLENSFERSLKLNDLQNLQDNISKLQAKTNSTEVNNNLLERKRKCLTKINFLQGKVKEIEEKSNRDFVIIERDTRRISKDPASEMAKIETQFSAVKKEIQQFVGIHADHKYYELEGSISALLIKLDSLHLPKEHQLYIRKVQLISEMKLYSQLLDKKAKETEIIKEIGKHLNAINSRMDNYRGTNEELKVMESELKSVHSKLEKIQIGEVHRKNLQQKFDVLFETYNRLAKAKEAPKNIYIGSTSFLQDVENLNKGKAPVEKQNSIEFLILEIQKEIDRIKSQVEVFQNSDTSDEYRQIEDNLLKLKLKVKQLDIPKSNQLYQRKLQLDESIQRCFTALDERVQETDSLIHIEKNIEEIGKKFDGITTEEDMNSVDEQLISLQVKLGKLHVSDELNQRKNMCTNRLVIYSKQLKDKSLPNADTNVQEETVLEKAG